MFNQLNSLDKQLHCEQDTLACGRWLAENCFWPGIIYLNGQLGAGKTTLVRGMLMAYGHQGKVKSPTYTLVEEYQLGDRQLYHFDLYRLNDCEELEFMGIREYCHERAMCLFEWPEKGAGFLPPADLVIKIDINQEGRLLNISSYSDIGQQTLSRMMDA